MLACSYSFMELHHEHRPPDLLPNIKGSLDLEYIYVLKLIAFLHNVVWHMIVYAGLLEVT